MFHGSDEASCCARGRAHSHRASSGNFGVRFNCCPLLRTPQHRVQLDTAANFSLSANEVGGEGRGGHGANRWVTTKGQDIGNSFWLYLLFFRGYAVEISLVGRSASSLRGIGVQGPGTVCATLSSVSYQPQNWLQMEGTFFGRWLSQSARSVASAQTSCPFDSSPLDCAPSSVASASASLGKQENSGLSASAVSAPESAGGADHQPIPSTPEVVWGAPPASAQRTPGSSVGSECCPKIQPSMDRRLQRLVPHTQWSTSGTLDRSRSVQSIPAGDSLVARSAMATRSGSFYAVVRQVWTARDHSGGQRRTLCFPWASGFVASERMVDGPRHSCGVYRSRPSRTKCWPRTEASNAEGRNDPLGIEHDAGTATPNQPLATDLQSGTSSRSFGAAPSGFTISSHPTPECAKSGALEVSQRLGRSQCSQQRADSMAGAAAICRRSFRRPQTWPEAIVQWMLVGLFPLTSLGRITRVGCWRTPAFGLRPPASDQTQTSVTYVVASSVTYVLATFREVARLNSNPLAPALSPLGRGEGVGGSVKLRPTTSRTAD